MINDFALQLALHSSHWKYVDDLTISEVFTRGSTSSLQGDLDGISNWAFNNNMNLNPKKCKEMLICPLRIKPERPASLVNNHPLDVVFAHVHKVLGIILCNTMTWNVYFALVRSILEYCCVTWATCVTAYLMIKLNVFKNEQCVFCSQRSTTLMLSPVQMVPASRSGITFKPCWIHDCITITTCATYHKPTV